MANVVKQVGIQKLTSAGYAYTPLGVDAEDVVFQDTENLEVKGAYWDTKVDSEAGKGLSTNDYTDAEKNKLAGIENNAQVNKFDKILVNGVEVSPSNKEVDLVIGPTTVGAAPTDHASTTTTYGIGTDLNYGHVKVVDDLEGWTAATSIGVASSAAAATNIYSILKDTVILDNFTPLTINE